MQNFSRKSGISRHFLGTELLARFRSTVLFLREMTLFFHVCMRVCVCVCVRVYVYVYVYVTSPLKISEPNERCLLNVA
jgi:hypothetical protein